ncbi:hypothetical protein VTN00DRAFT_10320 [Thermoascus crustaceus]|uniref:uncharacterized protein n=1 Tax=Thermoascus crustaceus TaxID=5088 RepID=UPI003743CC00
MKSLIHNTLKKKKNQNQKNRNQKQKAHTTSTTDPDNDSEMLSSQESDQFSHEEATHTGARTPTGAGPNVHDELSPPGSMKQQQQQQQFYHHNQQGQGAGGVDTKGAEKPQPGASWMNKRAEEEYQRAMEYVVDRDFSLREFGDPFDERDMTEKVL